MKRYHFRDKDNSDYWDHETFMVDALLMAEQSQGRGDQGIGAVVVFPSGKTVSEGDCTTSDGDPLAHAEMLALKKALLLRQNLQGCVLYSTCEPCPMCAAAANECGIREVVFGAFSNAHGFVSSGAVDLNQLAVSYQGGVLGETCLKYLNSRLLETAHTGKDERPISGTGH